MKGLLQPIMPKVLEFNKENSLIFVVFNKLPSSTQRKLLDILLYFGKQYMQKMQIENPEEYAFLEKVDFKNFIIPIKINIKTLFSILDMKRKNKKQLIEVINHLEEVSYQKIDVLNGEGGIEIKHLISGNDEKEILNKYGDQIKVWEKDRIIIKPRLDFDNDVFTGYLSPTITKYIVKNEKYTRINILIHTFLKSTYTINLYDILVSKFKAQKEMMEKNKIPKSEFIQTGYFKLENLQDMLGLKKDHSWRPFKLFNQRVLEPAIKEINNSNVTEFEIVEVLRKTKKRKVTELSFVLKPKESFNIPALVDEQIILTNEEELVKLKNKLKEHNGNKKNEPNSVSNEIQKKLLDLKNKILNKQISYTFFKRELLNLPNVEICNFVEEYKPYFILRTNDLGHLELFNPLDNSIISFKEHKELLELEKIKKWLYRNPKRIGDIKKINIELENIKNKILNKHIFKIQKGYYKIYKITDIEKMEDDNMFVTLFDEINKKSLNKVKISKNIEKLYEFKEDEISYYKELNKQKELEDLINYFKNNKNKLEDFIAFIDEKYLKILDAWQNAKVKNEKENLEKQLEIISSKQNRLIELLENPESLSVTDKPLLKEFASFAKGAK